MNETPLYPYSAEEARCRGELSLWRASYLTNIDCKEAIEKAVRQHFDGTYLEDGCLKEVLQKFGYKRTAWVLANTIQQLEWHGRYSLCNKAWAQAVSVPPDEQHNLSFVVRSHTTVLDSVVNQYRQAYRTFDLFGPEHCEPDSLPELDYKGKVLALSPSALKESHWSPQDQLWFANSGFGCLPHALEETIRATCLADGETTRWNRGDFIGPRAACWNSMEKRRSGWPVRQRSVFFLTGSPADGTHTKKHFWNSHLKRSWTGQRSLPRSAPAGTPCSGIWTCTQMSS